MKTAYLIAVLFVTCLVPLANAQSSPGKQLFESKCARCHGKDGAKGLMGAANLRYSNLSDQQYRLVITNGKGKMPSWSKKLTLMQIDAIIGYIKQFRK